MDQASQRDRFHIINDVAIKEKKLDPIDLAAFLAVNNIKQMSKQYNVVSIIGSQSTGKSTLLNKLFNTQFDVQQRSQQLGQTTVGIWLSRDQKSNTLVLDVEGSDSVERKSSETMVENQTALFALALSHAFIINVFLNSLGQHTSCQLSIIRIIMQMNLKLFQQDTVKNIVFVIRDWEEDANLEEATHRLNKYLQDIWKDIPKPEGMENTAFEDLFRVQVETLCYFRMKEFKEQTDQLRLKLVDQQDKDFIFKSFDYERNLPADALPTYLTNIWDVIANNKDLNLPNEKILVSNLRCQQIKVDSFEAVKKYFEVVNRHHLCQEIAENVKKGYYVEFGTKGRLAISEANEKYLKEAKDYAKDVVQEKQVELENEVMSKLFALFQKQVEQLKKYLLEEFAAVMDQLKDQPLTQLPGLLRDIHEEIPSQFSLKIQESIIIPDVWKEEDYVNSFETQVESQIQNFIQNQLTIYNQRQDKLVKQKLDNDIEETIQDVDEHFWGKVQAKFDTIVKIHYKQFEAILTDFMIPDKDKEQKLTQFEKDCYHNLEIVIKSQTSRFKEALFQRQFNQSISRFKRKFNRNEEGQPRDWKKMTEEEILHLFTEQKDAIWVILQVLKQSQIKAKSISMLMHGQKVIRSVLVKKEIQINDDGQLIDIERTVLSEVALANIKNNLTEEFDSLYQEALQKHKQDFLQNIPKWFWFMLLFFMYDDVLRWLGNPLFLYPILMIICFVGFCIAIGYHGLPKALFGQLIKQFNIVLGPLLFGGLSKLKGA